MLSNSPVLNFPSVKKKNHSELDQYRGFQPANSQLAPYASHALASHGRLIGEGDCLTRSCFARDRDRIVHSTAFRRLNYKTQVFIYHEGDHFRSRLTHSLEVAQIARSLARIMRLDEDLCEAISLAHDIGHTPFGHAGERALSEALENFGGFDHNLQTLRVLTSLEQRYVNFDGLNLSWETLEGLIKHNGPLTDLNGEIIVSDARADMRELVRWYEKKYGFGLHQHAGPEGQVAAVADDIAYNNHDIDDGLRAGLFELDDLQDVPFVWDIVKDIKKDNAGVVDARLVFELNRRLITLMIADVRDETAKRLAELLPKASDDIRNAGRPVIAFSGEFADKLEELRIFLFERVYRDERVMRIMGEAEKITRDLVRHYMNRPQDLPGEWRCSAVGVNINECAERIRDFIAGMTDRYIIDLHRSLFDVTPKLR
jgi:dGTPase